MIAGFVLVLVSDRLAYELGNARRAARELGARQGPARPRDLGRRELRALPRRAPASCARRWPLLTLAALAGSLSVFALLSSRCARSTSAPQVSLVEAFAAWAFVRLIGTIPITPGGIGVVELGLTSTLVGFGGNNAGVVAAVLVFRFLTMVPTLVFGLVVAATWRRHARAAAARPVGRCRGADGGDARLQSMAPEDRPRPGRPNAAGRVEQARASAARATDWAKEVAVDVARSPAALERERLSVCGLLAGGLAYRLFFWIVPLGLVVAAILSFWVEADPTGSTTPPATTASAARPRARRWMRSRREPTSAGTSWSSVSPCCREFGGGVVRAISVAHSISLAVAAAEGPQAAARRRPPSQRDRWRGCSSSRPARTPSASGSPAPGSGSSWRWCCLLHGGVRRSRCACRGAAGWRHVRARRVLVSVGIVLVYRPLSMSSK